MCCFLIKTFKGSIIMVNPSRYIVRKEFYGALVYDTVQDSYLAFDEELYRLLQLPVEELKLDHDLFAMLTEEGFVVNEKKNYYCHNNTFKGETLSSPARIHFYYTTQCNMNCKHCFTKKSNIGDELTFAEKCNMIDQMKALGINEILVGGGEPFIRDDFLDFLEYSLKQGISTKVFTNGVLLDDRICKALSKMKLTYLSISVDGTTEDEYESVRGVRALYKVKENIRNIKNSCDFPVAISVTVNNNNYLHSEKYLEFAHNCGVDRVKVRPTKPSGNILDNPSIYLRPECYLQFITTMQKEWNRKYKNEFRLDFSWGDSRLFYNQESDSIEVADIIFPYEGYGCFAGKGSMVVSANGQVSPCGFLPIRMQFSEDDNIKTKSIKEIWDTGKQFDNLRHLTGNPVCENCCYFGICRGGCIARILYAGKEITDVDPWCLAKFFPAKLGE